MCAFGNMYYNLKDMTSSKKVIKNVKYAYILVHLRVTCANPKASIHPVQWNW